MAKRKKAPTSYTRYVFTKGEGGDVVVSATQPIAGTKSIQCPCGDRHVTVDAKGNPVTLPENIGDICDIYSAFNSLGIPTTFQKDGATYKVTVERL